MQKFLVSSVLAGLLASGSAAAAAPGEFRGAARLVTPVSAPAEAVISGVAWRCAADGCVGLAQRYNTLESVGRECRQVAARFGPVSAYASRGQRLGRSGLAACNRAAASGRFVTAQYQ